MKTNQGTAFNLETACRRILGQAKLETFQQLSPGQIMKACAMLEEGWPPGLVQQAVEILRRYRWFKIAGIDVTPWEINESHWDELIKLAPWKHKDKKKKINGFEKPPTIFPTPF